ncbi:MAG: PAS domain S-box protein [Acidobacteriota bacterium]|nr:PAS domain S-box protein [Acidobacteriota bacterium]
MLFLLLQAEMGMAFATDSHAARHAATLPYMLRAPAHFLLLSRYALPVLLIAVAALTACYVWDILQRRAKVEQEVRVRTHELDMALGSLAEANRGLEESELRFRRLVEELPLAMVVECHGRIVLANQVAVEMYGVDPVAADRTYSMMDFVAPDDLEVAREIVACMDRGEEHIAPLEGKLLRADGNALDIELFPSSGLYSGELARQIVFRDITQRKRGELENIRLSRAIEQAGESVVMTDAEARIVYVNPAFERISGYSRAESLGQNPRILSSGRQSAEFYAAMWKKLKAGESWTGRFINRRKNGTLYIEEATISPVVDREGCTVNYVAVKRDITVETDLQEKLNQSQKMEAIGRLAGGVAHDFNNMLMVINSYTELLASSLDEGDSRRRYTEKIHRAADRSAGLTRQLLAFGRKQSGNLAVLDCNAILGELSGMVQRLVSEKIEVRCKLTPGLLHIKADADQLMQVMLNLCVNARDAMPAGGVLTMSSRNCEDEAGFIELAVSDTGVGIPEEARTKLFEPFYTTKPQGKGTGLGLAIVYGIVQQLGGYIRVESEPAKGATFRVFLPSCSETPSGKAQAQTQAQAVTNPAGPCLVLLAEDEETLRLAIAEQLRRRGYQVLCAANGEEGLEALQSNPGVQVLVTDMVMPRMGGRELAMEASRQLPGLCIMLLSGYAEEHLDPVDCNGCPVVFLQKPFTLSTMVERLEQLRTSV